MNPTVALVLGLLIGWLIEWVIDWIYWRRRSSAALQAAQRLRERLLAAEERSAALEHQLGIQQVNLSRLQEKLSAAEAEIQARAEVPPARGSEAIPVEPPAAARPAPDDLIAIKGIGPVIAGKLNHAGIYTFADLAALTPGGLRALVGDAISRLADETSIIEQARQLEAKKRLESER